MITSSHSKTPLWILGSDWISWTPSPPDHKQDATGHDWPMEHFENTPVRGWEDNTLGCENKDAKGRCGPWCSSVSNYSQILYQQFRSKGMSVLRRKELSWMLSQKGGGEEAETNKQTNRPEWMQECRFWHEGGLQSLRIYFRSHTCQVMEMKFEEIKEPGRNKVRAMKTFFSHQQTIFNKKIRKTINLIWNVVCLFLCS